VEVSHSELTPRHCNRFKQTIVELGDLNDTMSGLVKACKYILDNFDARQAARAAEIDALKEAKAILSGMK